MKIEPYLFFEGRCDEAIEFYKQALGAEVKMLMRFKEMPGPGTIAPGLKEKVMHANLQIGDNTVLLSDGHAEGQPNFHGFALTIEVTAEAEAKRLFAALTDGGKVVMPLSQTFYSPSFGMLTDRFGLMWMIITTA